MQVSTLTTTVRNSIRRKEQAAVRPRPRALRRFAPLITLTTILVLWQGVILLELYPAFIIPPPISVVERLVDVLRDGSLWRHASVTLQEVLLGLAFGLSIGLVLGYLIARNPLLEDLIAPIVVSFQSTPIVAYAPLLVIWFGSGLTSKVFTSSLIVFFPILMNTIVGIRQVPPNLHDLMRSLQASRWQTFVKLEVPAALPVLMTGLKTSATLAVIGAVVGEFVSARDGLGFLVNDARFHYDTALVLVAVLAMTTIARSLYSLIALVERRVLAWQIRVTRY